MLCHIILYYIILCHIILDYIMPYHIRLCHAISYYIILCHIILDYIMSYHIKLYYAISYKIILSTSYSHLSQPIPQFFPLPLLLIPLLQHYIISCLISNLSSHNDLYLTLASTILLFRYCSKELIVTSDGQTLDLRQADIFSLGASVYEMCLGRELGSLLSSCPFNFCYFLSSYARSVARLLPE